MIAGWSSIVLGVLGTIFPILPGLPFLFIGAHLIGRRDPRLRWARVHTKLVLRWMSRSRIPMLRHFGQWARQTNHQVEQYSRRWRAEKTPVVDDTLEGMAPEGIDEQSRSALGRANTTMRHWWRTTRRWSGVSYRHLHAWSGVSYRQLRKAWQMSHEATARWNERRKAAQQPPQEHDISN
jgi:hypothetical protein